MRAATSWKNASLSITSNPRRRHAVSMTSISQRDRLPVIVDAPPVFVPRSRSSCCWPASSFSRAVSSRAASSLSV